MLAVSGDTVRLFLPVPAATAWVGLAVFGALTGISALAAPCPGIPLARVTSAAPADSRRDLA